MMEPRHWLALIRTPGAGPVSLKALLDYLGSQQVHFPLRKADLPSRLGLSTAATNWLLNPDRDHIDADIAWMSANDCHLVTLDSTRYPELLSAIPDPPLALFVQGNVDLLKRRQLAIVGSRNPTAQGIETARDFSQTLANAGLLITSGMAMGIDCSPANAFANPKSSTFILSSSVTLILAGFRSRWMTPLS